MGKGRRGHHSGLPTFPLGHPGLWGGPVEPLKPGAIVDGHIGLATEVSSQGKLLIPKAPRENLKLADQATVVGRGPHFEIWEPENFKVANSPAAVAELDKIFNMIS